MRLLDFEPVTPFSEPSNCEFVMLYSLTGVGLPDRMGSTDIEEQVWGETARAAGEWMCPSADGCVYSWVLPESVKMDFSSWAWLRPGDESTLQLDFRFSRHEPSKLCLRGPPGAGSLLWVISPAWPCTHLLVWPQDASPPRAPVSGTLHSAGEGTCSGSGLPVHDPWTLSTDVPSRPAAPCLQVRHPLRPPFLGGAGLSEPVFTGEAWMRPVLWVLWRLRL